MQKEAKARIKINKLLESEIPMLPSTTLQNAAWLRTRSGAKEVNHPG